MHQMHTPETLEEALRQSIAAYIDAHYRAALKKLSAMPCCSAPEMLGGKTMCCSDGVGSLEDMLRKADAGFSQTLLSLIDRSGQKDADIYKKANISKQVFSKIRNNPDYRPTKATALAFALALELDVSGTNDLIGRAGYTLSNSSKFDLIIRYFIEQGTYNIVLINTALYEFDQPLLGG